MSDIQDRFDRRPRAWLALGVVGVLALALCGVSLVAPAMVESRARSRLARMGLTFDAEDIDVGLGGISFEQVVSQSGAQQVFRAEHVALGVAWWRLGDGPVRALDDVEIAGLEIDMTADDFKRFRGSASEASAAAPSEPETAEPAALPSVSVHDMRMRVRDRAGVLIRAEGITAELRAGSWQASVEALSVGSAPSDVISVQTARASGALDGRRPVVKLASADKATLSWASAKGTAAHSPESTLSRLKALKQALGPPTSEAAAASAGGPRALWSDDARIDLRNMRVVETEPSGAASPILEGLEVGLSAQGSDALRLTGKGSAPGSGGKVSWDLRAVPAEARVEGTVALHDVSLALFGPVLPPLPFFELEQTRVRADLELTGRGLESIAVKGNLDVRDLAFASEGLARTPVGPFGFSARGEGTWTPARRELSNVRGQLSSGEVTLSGAGTLAWPSDGYRVDFVAELPRSRCEEVLSAVPGGILDELETIELGGNIDAKLTVHVDSAALDATKVDFDIDDDCNFGALPPLLDLSRFQQPFAHRVLEPDGTTFEMETGPGSAVWTPIELVSPFLIQAVVAHEDGRFFGHRGFAEPEIAVALSRNLKAKAFRFGASTITMQLVKNVFLHRDKLLSRKVQEALIVWWLEQHWDKRRILELYLNVIEYGPAIYGIRNAALHYFGQIPTNLTPAQSAFLASILPSPKTSHAHYEKGALSSGAKSRVASLLKHMHSRQRIDDEALAYGLEELESFKFYDPKGAPPLPPQVRGSAQPPPFDMASPLVDPWDTFRQGFGPSEDGSFGAP